MPVASAPRLQSVDALRGLAVAAMLLVNNPGDWGHVYAPLQHARWHGCTPTDLIFPLFLFIVGVSLSLSVGGRLDAGADAAALRRSVTSRALRIAALGLVLHAIAFWLLDQRAFRPLGVLQRIGACYLVAGWFVISATPRTQWLAFTAILVGYAALLALGGDLTREGNVASRFDTWLLGRHAYEFDPVTGRGHEPEGVLSTLPAIATTLLGVRAGDWLRAGCVPRLWQAGALALALGAAWALLQPLNKQLWTSSYVLWTGGWSLLGLALAHHAIDRRGAPPVGRAFGVNAIAAYGGAWLAVCVLDGSGASAAIYRAAFAWMTPITGPALPSLLYAVAFVAVWAAVMVLLDRRRLYLKL